MSFDISPAHNTARLAGTLAFADTGTANSRLCFYDTPQPALGGDPGGTALVQVTLSKPSGVIAGGVLALSQADLTGDLITASGAALWGRWVNGNGDLVGDGTVSDSAPGSTGFFKLAGTTGTTLYAGARVLLGSVALS